MNPESVKTVSDNFRRVRDALSHLLDSNPPEEVVHQFLLENPFLFSPHDNPQASRFGINGYVSKFPLSPDRIPDFVLPFLACCGRRNGSRINLLELKPPAARLLTWQGRMSSDLNDAFTESLDSLRVFRHAFPDILQRLHHSILENMSTAQRERDTQSREFVPSCNMYYPPNYKCFVLIGRRRTLDTRDLHRIAHIYKETRGTIRIAPYDFLLDALDRAMSQGKCYAWL
jgi:hypothetical protein